MFRKVGAPAKKPAPPPPAAAPAGPASASESESEASDSERSVSSAGGSEAAAFPPPRAQPQPQAAPKREPAPKPPTPVVGRTADDSDGGSSSSDAAAFPAPRVVPPPPQAELGRRTAATQEERIAQEWAFQAAMSNDADREEHTHDPPPPEGTHLDRFGFICPLSESVSQSKEEAALELRRARAAHARRPHALGAGSQACRLRAR